MANNGWFRCDGCGNEVKALVPDWITVLQRKCERCGGTFRKT